ncbi:TIGR04211 family SH3 domain-containing protein [Cellvibrio mixtus]|uniref:TIGR04211 family SH3 domain-containing protein n=1 Tax=Cellvibrio mixtus TaxID=39650 RepID=UPI000A9FD027|nr:TIGR04211 family SH3 domain-containing protein [Cellvibrio mixtus]
MKNIPLPGSTLSILALSLISSSVFAVDRYVSDVIYVPVRSDKNPQASVLQQGVGSGTKLNFIREETGTDNNLWSLVVTPDGTEGWIRSQNLTDKPTAAMQLAALSGASKDVVALQTENTQLKAQLTKIQQEHQQLLTDTEDMRQAATTALNLEDEHQRLLKENQLLQTHADVVKADNEKLKNTDRFNHWVYGGGLVLGGVILSFVLQGLGRRKRKSEWR